MAAARIDPSQIDYGSVLRAGLQRPLAEATDLPPGRERANVLQCRAEERLPLYCPDDAPALPPDVNQPGQHDHEPIADRRYRIATAYREEEAIEQELLNAPVDWRSSFLTRLGVELGNPSIDPCPACLWRHEAAGRCTWCGYRKGYP
jgi:hypothetical protein